MTSLQRQSTQKRWRRSAKSRRSRRKASGCAHLCWAACAGLTRPGARQEKKLALENLKTHKDNAHKLQTDLASADQSRTELVQSLKQLMEDAGAQETMLDELRAQTAKMSELSGALQVLKAKRDTTVAENQKRKLALGREVDDSSLEQLLGVQVRPLAALPRLCLSPPPHTA